MKKGRLTIEVLLILGTISLLCVIFEKHGLIYDIIPIIIIVILGITIIIVSFYGEYDEWKAMFKVQLIQLNLDNEEDVIYLQKIGMGIRFRRGFESEFGTEKNLEYIGPNGGLLGENPITIEIVESSSIIEPYLCVQYRYYIGVIWFPTIEQEFKYTFYVPTGTITEYVSTETTTTKNLNESDS